MCIFSSFNHTRISFLRPDQEHPKKVKCFILFHTITPMLIFQFHLTCHHSNCLCVFSDDICFVENCCHLTVVMQFLFGFNTNLQSSIGHMKKKNHLLLSSVSVNQGVLIIQLCQLSAIGL